MGFSAVRIGRLFANITGTSGSITQIVPPSQNTRGLIVTSVFMSATTGGTGLLFADTVAPSAANDTTKRVIFGAENPVSGGLVQETQMPYPFIIEAGLGLWFTVQAANVAIAITYDLLDGATT